MSWIACFFFHFSSTAAFATYHSGLVIVFPWDGPCGMMVISSNQHMMRSQYFRFFYRLFSGCYHCHKIFFINKIFTQENITVLQTKLPSRKRTEKGTGKTNFVETRTFWHIFRSFDRLWTFLILALQVFVLKYRIRRPTSVLL